MMLHTKYQGSRPVVSGRKIFHVFRMLAYVKHVNSRAQPFLTKWAFLNKLGPPGFNCWISFAPVFSFIY